MKFSKQLQQQQQQFQALTLYQQQQQQQEYSPSSSSQNNTQLQSERVMQLKREIEDLDSRLLQTNTINIDDIRKSMGIRNIQASQQSSDEYADYRWPNNVGRGKEVASLRSSVHIYKQMISGSAGLKQNQVVNASHIEGDDVSFDIEKISKAKNLNLKSALETNLQQKKDFISDLEFKVFKIMKEGDAKCLKITHLKFERDNIISQYQKEQQSFQKKPTTGKNQSYEAKEQLKRIDIKKKEDERAYSIAQSEIRRCIGDQEKITGDILGQIEEWEHEVIPSVTQEQVERIQLQKDKINSLTGKKVDVESNVVILRNFLKQIGEEIQMTQEDLSGKLMQRAEFVAQREELDQMYDSGRLAFGKCFELYLKINDINGAPSGSTSARFLGKEYETEKNLSFFASLMQQLKQSCKSKYHQSIDQVQVKIQNSALTKIDIDSCLTWVCQLATQLSIQLDKGVLLRRLDLANQEKDEVYSQRQRQLRDIILEIKRFEVLIKENSNLVDNMILPQLKAMSTTYQEHKLKYKKLKQAGFVFRERLKKAEREMLAFSKEQSKLHAIQQHALVIEQDMQALTQSLKLEQEEMDRLIENASQIDKEYRRAQQTLLLKEREILHRMGDSSSTQIQQQKEDERVKKRFNEIEDKIRNALLEKENTDLKLNEYQQQLKEAKESCEHALQVVMNSQRALQEIPNRHILQEDIVNNDAYQVTSFTDNENNNEYGSKVKPEVPTKFKKESMTKLDLSKIVAENNNSNYSEQRQSIFENINYEKQMKPVDRYLYDSTTLAEGSTLIEQMTNNKGHHVNMFNEDFVNMLQQSKQQDTSSLMNLSDLIVDYSNHNNDAHRFQLRQSQSSAGGYLPLQEISNHQQMNNSQSSKKFVNLHYVDVAPGMRRSSIETADFLMNDKVDVRQQQQQISPTRQYRGFQNNQNRPMVTQSVNFNSQTHSTQRSNQPPHLNWMSKYLNTGNQFSRMPQEASTNQQQLKWNRSSSLENNRSYNSQTREGRASRQHKKNRKLNKSINGCESSTLLQQSMASSSLLNPVAMSVNFGHNLQSIQNLPRHQMSYNPGSLHEPSDMIHFSKVDVSFAERIVPLLDGAAFYKKFSSRQSLNENCFDPLNSDKIPPENCGYGIRLFQLDKSLQCINVRMSLKIAVETTISLNDIVKPILPQTTMDIIRAQKQFVHNHIHNHSHHGQRKNNKHCSQHACQVMGGSSSTNDLLEEFLILESKGSISHLAKIGIVNKNSELYRQKCLDSTFYPFSIALTNGRVELIATNYETLKNWIIGINLLVSNKKHIPKLKQLMELKLD